MKNKRYLKIELIWKDDDMIELQVSSNNGRYSGMTEVYDTRESLLEFASSLKEYPSKPDIIKYETGQQDSSFGYFGMKCYPIGELGIIGVQITLENKAATAYRLEEKDKLTMELIVEPNAIDVFQREWLELIKKEDREAELVGIPRHASFVK